MLRERSPDPLSLKGVDSAIVLQEAPAVMHKQSWFQAPPEPGKAQEAP